MDIHWYLYIIIHVLGKLYCMDVEYGEYSFILHNLLLKKIVDHQVWWINGIYIHTLMIVEHVSTGIVVVDGVIDGQSSGR